MRSRPLVMIVEDEPDILTLLRVVIEMDGYDSVLAADGRTALERFDVERPDVVLLDVMLPIMDGWSVLAEIQGLDDPPPVIICSAAHSARDIEVAEQRGAMAVLSKPLDMDLLRETIARVLEHRSVTRALRPLASEGPVQGWLPA